MTIPKHVRLKRIIHFVGFLFGLGLLGLNIEILLAQNASAHDVSIMSGISLFGITGIIAMVGVVASWVRMETQLAVLKESFKEKVTDLENQTRHIVPRRELDARLNKLSEQIDELPERLMNLLSHNDHSKGR